jgi:hypothetical protein
LEKNKSSNLGIPIENDSVFRGRREEGGRIFVAGVDFAAAEVPIE